jgi:hypothetical protein
MISLMQSEIAALSLLSTDTTTTPDYSISLQSTDTATHYPLHPLC